VRLAGVPRHGGVRERADPPWPVPEPDGGPAGSVVTARVGLVVNPQAATDVRRLTSLARGVDVHERVNAAARVLRGLAAAGVEEVSYMREPSGVVESAVQTLRALGLGLPSEVRPALTEEAASAAGTSAAAAALRVAEVACVVTLGGDGTNRAVASGWPDAVLVPLPAGTNNALATPLDPTAAGLAAGLFARHPARYRRHVRRVSRLEVDVDGEPAATALVDVAVVRGRWVGAHAIWEPGSLLEAVVAHASPVLTGLAGVAGMLRPLNGHRGPLALHLRFGEPGTAILAPLGPGALARLSVREWRELGPDERVELRAEGCTIAFDGERELVPAPGARITARPTRQGPYVLDAGGLLRALAPIKVQARGGTR
jgi:hypothetical protein